MKFLFLDTETTGINPDINGLVEIAAEYHVDGKKVSQWNSKMFAKQQSPIVNLQALKVNKHSIKGLHSLPDEAVALAEFCEWVLGLDTKDLIIVGHNIQFDINFIKAALKKYGVEGFELISSTKTIDTVGLARVLMYAGKLDLGAVTSVHGANVGNLARALGVDLSNRTLHTATDDIAVTAEIYYKMVALIKG